MRCIAAFTLSLHRNERFYPRFYAAIPILPGSYFFVLNDHLDTGTRQCAALPGSEILRFQGFGLPAPGALFFLACRSGPLLTTCCKAPVAAARARQAATSGPDQDHFYAFFARTGPLLSPFLRRHLYASRIVLFITGTLESTMSILSVLAFAASHRSHAEAFVDQQPAAWRRPVSYTHLTLPTNREV